MTKHHTRMYCFSPPVMVATFLVEFVLFIYTIIRYKMTAVSRLAAALLLLLGIFQLAEYNVCGRFGISVATWSRLGFVAITILPVLAVHLIFKIVNLSSKLILAILYAIAGFWVVTFGFSESAFSGHICAGNYAVFQLAVRLDVFYFTYYYGLLLLGIVLCLYYAKSSNLKVRKSLLLQLTGYLSFLVPTALANTVKPETINGIPSIMCGFAVIYALILAFGIVPLLVPERNKAKKV